MTSEYWYCDTISIDIAILQDSVDEAKESFKNVIKRIERYAEQCDINVFEATVDAEEFNPDRITERVVEE